MISYPLGDLLRADVLLLGQGWRDQDDADRLRHDPSFRVANDTRRGTAALEQDNVLPSQPTMSRLLEALSGEANQAVVREAVGELALRRLRMSNQGRRRKRLMIDVDGLPVLVLRAATRQRIPRALPAAHVPRAHRQLRRERRPDRRHAAARRGGVGRRGVAVHRDGGRALPAAGV